MRSKLTTYVARACSNIFLRLEGWRDDDLAIALEVSCIRGQENLSSAGGRREKPLISLVKLGFIGPVYNFLEGMSRR